LVAHHFVGGASLFTPLLSSRSQIVRNPRRVPRGAALPGP
jgi:hypothetical protein